MLSTSDIEQTFMAFLDSHACLKTTCKTLIKIMGLGVGIA